MFSKDCLCIASLSFADQMLPEFKVKQWAMNSAHCSESHKCYDNRSVCQRLSLPLKLTDSICNSPVASTVISEVITDAFIHFMCFTAV